MNTQLNSEFFFEGRAEWWASMVDTDPRLAPKPTVFTFWREPLN